MKLSKLPGNLFSKLFVCNVDNYKVVMNLKMLLSYNALYVPLHHKCVLKYISCQNLILKAQNNDNNIQHIHIDVIIFCEVTAPFTLNYFYVCLHLTD